MSAEFVTPAPTQRSAVVARSAMGSQRFLIATAATVAVLALAACTPNSPDTSATKSPSASASPSAEPTTAAPPELNTSGTADENLAYFDSIAQSVLAADPAAGGEAFVNALVAGGFNKADMEVGFDRTTVDLAADSVPWAIRFNGECLLGQFGPASGGYHSMVTPILPSGSCLVGATRPIDW